LPWLLDVADDSAVCLRGREGNPELNEEPLDQDELALQLIVSVEGATEMAAPTCTTPTAISRRRQSTALPRHIILRGRTD
jgi:hypothetical protein